MCIISPQVEQVCKILGEETSGSKITRMLSELNISCGLDERNTKWKRLFDAVNSNFLSSYTYDALIRIISYIMSPVNFIDEQEHFTEVQKQLNLCLSFMGLEMLDTAEVRPRKVATTLKEANQTISDLKSDLEKFKIHSQIMEYCRPEIISENLFHLVFEAAKCVLDELRNISGLNYDGNKLVNECFDGNNPRIILNKLSSDNEKSEHKGLQALLNTIVYLYRNPKAHQLKYFSEDTYLSTLEALIMISKARYALDRCAKNNTR